jgi:hypothetical protein
MAIASRTDLQEYCLRKLGKPVIRLNLDQQQIEDRTDEALQKFANYHFEGTIKDYFKHQVASQDVTNRYIDIGDPAVISVRRIFNVAASVINMFDVRYQIRLNDFYNFTNTSMVHYNLVMNHLDLLEFMLNPEKAIRFNRYQNRIYVDMDWGADVVQGSFLIFEVQRVIDPTEWVAAYDDEWLKLYLTALLKEQWGTNLSKFGGMQLPNGVTLNGAEIRQEGREEVQRLEERLRTEFQDPVDFQMG